MTVSPPIITDIATTTTTNPTLPSVETLFVWDFDWTIVNCNSDEYVPASFIGTKEMERRLRHMLEVNGPTKWHECVSSLICACLEERSNSTKRDVLDAAASMPYLMGVRRALEDVANNEKCGQAIISDGNDEFINAFVKRNQMNAYFTHGVETNFGHWVDFPNHDINNGKDTTTNTKEQFSVVHQSSKYGGHSCKKCPPNLCKTQVLHDILNRIEETERRRPRIVYVGDGSNDACPAIQVLDEGDILLARDGKRDKNPNVKSGEQLDEENTDTGSEFPILSTIEKRQKEDGLVPQCHIRAWNSGKELHSLIRGILDETR